MIFKIYNYTIKQINNSNNFEVFAPVPYRVGETVKLKKTLVLSDDLIDLLKTYPNSGYIAKIVELKIRIL